jgi:hypothetical protein
MSEEELYMNQCFADLLEGKSLLLLIASVKRCES